MFIPKDEDFLGGLFFMLIPNMESKIKIPLKGLKIVIFDFFKSYFWLWITIAQKRKDFISFHIYIISSIFRVYAITWRIWFLSALKGQSRQSFDVMFKNMKAIIRLWNLNYRKTPQTVPGTYCTFYFFLCDISGGLCSTGNQFLMAIFWRLLGIWH